jgi:DDE superfamily endonuclease
MLSDHDPRKPTLHAAVLENNKTGMPSIPEDHRVKCVVNSKFLSSWRIEFPQVLPIGAGLGREPSPRPRRPLPGHRSSAVRGFVAAQGSRLIMEWLPGYAPELNPVEHIWGYLKEHELPNLCPRELWQLSAAARLWSTFSKQAELFKVSLY